MVSASPLTRSSHHGDEDLARLVRKPGAVEKVTAKPDVFNHNLEPVPSVLADGEETDVGGAKIAYELEHLVLTSTR
jgi:lipoate synthase